MLTYLFLLLYTHFGMLTLEGAEVTLFSWLVWEKLVFAKLFDFWCSIRCMCVFYTIALSYPTLT